MNPAAAASLETQHSAHLPLPDHAPDKPGVVALLDALLHQTTVRSVKTWNKLSRRARILLLALLMTTSSFGLSMIVATLAR